MLKYLLLFRLPIHSKHHLLRLVDEVRTYFTSQICASKYSLQTE